MSPKGKVACDIVETLDRATVVAAGARTASGISGPVPLLSPACMPFSINVRTSTRRPVS
jgi:hypothetical protein